MGGSPSARELQGVGMPPFKAALLSLVALPGLALPASADAPQPDCEAHAAAAGQAAGIPDGLLPAIARVEAGHDGRAWPWTLNQGGDGSFHGSKAEALARLDAILASGVQNVDLGCMQINWRWHSHAFADAATMLDPIENTRYAARFLTSLHEQLGSWDSAVRAYHSSNPALGEAYGQKVAMVRGMILGQSDGLPPLQLAELSSPTRRHAQPVMTRGLLALSGTALVGPGETNDLRAGRGTGWLPQADSP